MSLSAGNKPPLASARRLLRGWDSPLQGGSSRVAQNSAAHRPGSAPSSGRPFAPPTPRDSQAVTPRLGRANTEVPRLLLLQSRLAADVQEEQNALSAQPTGRLGPSCSDQHAVSGHREAVQMRVNPAAWSQSGDVDSNSESESVDGDSECSFSDDESELLSGPSAVRYNVAQQILPVTGQSSGISTQRASPFQFTGDLDADVAALEALEDSSSYGFDTQR